METDETRATSATIRERVTPKVTPLYLSAAALGSRNPGALSERLGILRETRPTFTATFERTGNGT